LRRTVLRNPRTLSRVKGCGTLKSGGRRPAFAPAPRRLKACATGCPARSALAAPADQLATGQSRDAENAMPELQRRAAQPRVAVLPHLQHPASGESRKSIGAPPGADRNPLILRGWRMPAPSFGKDVVVAVGNLSEPRIYLAHGENKDRATQLCRDSVDWGVALHDWVFAPDFLEGSARDCVVAVLSWHRGQFAAALIEIGHWAAG
jgi:hypothetical protein